MWESSAALYQPIVLLLIFIAFLVFFHVFLIFVLNLNERQWKRVDYVWLVVAFLSIPGIALQVQTYLANIKLHLAVDDLNNASYWAEYIEGSTTRIVCNKTARRTEFSPANFDEIVQDQKLLCDWMNNAMVRLTNYFLHEKEINTEKFFTGYDFPLVANQDQIRSTMREYVDKYNAALKVKDNWIKEIRRLQGPSWHSILIVLSPFFLTFAIALRITKVSGEIKLLARRAQTNRQRADQRHGTDAIEQSQETGDEEYVLVARVVEQSVTVAERKSSSKQRTRWSEQLLREWIGNKADETVKNRYERLLDLAIDNKVLAESTALKPSFGFFGQTGKRTIWAKPPGSVYFVLKEGMYPKIEGGRDHVLQTLKDTGLLDKNLEVTDIVDGRATKVAVREMTDEQFDSLIKLIDRCIS